MMTPSEALLTLSKPWQNEHSGHQTNDASNRQKNIAWLNEIKANKNLFQKLHIFLLARYISAGKNVFINGTWFTEMFWAEAFLGNKLKH